jgi:hypothetical protein
MPSFTKKVMEDRDSEQSPGDERLSKRWPGRISEKGFLSFLSSGYAADDISDSPGGFSIFMFSPLGAPKAADQKTDPSGQVDVWERQLDEVDREEALFRLG